MKIKYHPEIHHRRSIRMREYDYSQEGAYFVTVRTYKGECILGEILNGQMELNELGTIVQREWLKTSQLRHNVMLDEYVIMPNHFHGIVVIVDEGGKMFNKGRGVLQYAPTKFRSPSQTLGAIIRGFKSATTKITNRYRHSPGDALWQRNYYEHVIRDEDDLHQIREYINNNPLKWEFDQENPKNAKTAS